MLSCNVMFCTSVLLFQFWPHRRTQPAFSFGILRSPYTSPYIIPEDNPQFHKLSRKNMAVQSLCQVSLSATNLYPSTIQCFSDFFQSCDVIAFHILYSCNVSCIANVAVSFTVLHFVSGADKKICDILLYYDQERVLVVLLYVLPVQCFKLLHLSSVVLQKLCNNYQCLRNEQKKYQEPNRVFIFISINYESSNF